MEQPPKSATAPAPGGPVTPEHVSPTFRTHCDHARHADPGRYEHAGRLLVRQTIATTAATADQVRLLELLLDGDDMAVLGWLKDHYPKHLRLVPRRRHAAFLNGVYRGHDGLEQVVMAKLLDDESADGAVGATGRPPEQQVSRSILHLLRPSLN